MSYLFPMRDPRKFSAESHGGDGGSSAEATDCGSFSSCPLAESQTNYAEDTETSSTTLVPITEMRETSRNQSPVSGRQRP